MKKYLVLLFVMLATKAFCQYDFRAQLHLANYMSPQNDLGMRLSRNIINVMGISAEGNAYKNIYIRCSYQQWQTVVETGFGFKDYYRDRKFSYYTSKPGDLWSRWSYKMCDVTGGYRRVFLGRHDIYANVGASYAFGTDVVLVGIYQEPDYGDLQVSSKEASASYVGMTWEIGYNCGLFNSKINVGPSFSGRHYPNQFTQYNVQLNIGYNFNLLKKTRDSNNKKGLRPLF